MAKTRKFNATLWTVGLVGALMVAQPVGAQEVVPEECQEQGENDGPNECAEALLLGCTAASFASDGSHANYFRTGGNSYQASGAWEDGCGGYGCDDRVDGSTAIGGVTYTFSVNDNYVDRVCSVVCTLVDDNGIVSSGSGGNVSPGKSGTKFTMTYQCKNDDGSTKYEGFLRGDPAEAAECLLSAECGDGP